MTSSVRLQPLTRSRVAALGEAGATWAAALPEVLAQLEGTWSIRIGRTLPGGSSSYVACATTADGGKAVVKVAITADGLADQAETLRRADGRGYARLYGFDADRNALLLEALGPPLERSSMAPEDQLCLVADTLALAWQDTDGRRPAPGEDKASGLHGLITRLARAFPGACSEDVLNQALDFAERRTVVDDADLVVVHGDPHPGNLLAVAKPRPGAETSYCFVDPDGFVCDRAYDLGVLLRDWTLQLEAGDARATLHRYCRLVADHTGVDEIRIWEWAFVERVSTGLYVRSFGADRVAAPFLRTAELLV